jgi:hypothetical protein
LARPEPIDSVQLLKMELLIGKLGMSPENIGVSEVEHATHRAIADPTKPHSTARIKRGGVVVHYFSVSGSRVGDISGDAADKLDRIVTPYKGRMPGVLDIGNRGINGPLQQLERKTKDVGSSFDSRSSRAAARGGNAVAGSSLTTYSRRTPARQDSSGRLGQAIGQ